MGLLPEFPRLAADRVLRAALEEDVGRGDVTTLATVPAGKRVRAVLVAKEPMRLAGLPAFTRTFELLSPADPPRWALRHKDGEEVEPGTRIAEGEGDARTLLTGERTALNFLQTLSGTATAARRYVEAVRGTGCRILDTRKTLPGLRLAQKYAVRCGGGTNHRLGLYDGILIKENHIAAAGSIAAAVAAARRLGGGVPVEVEVETLEELEQAFAAEADLALLDEFSLADLATAVARNRARPRPLGLEASGGIDLDTIGAVAATGVDFISVGSITKHVRALDLSMRLEVLG